MQELQLTVKHEGVDLSLALATVTKNPADALGLLNKGRLEVGADADLIFLDPDNLTLESVICKGQCLLIDNKLRMKTYFEV